MKSSAGFVYFLSAKGYGAGVKIGFSKHPEGMRRELQYEYGVPLRMNIFIPGTKQDEKKLHKMFAGSRMHGEWFKTNRNMNRLIAYLGHEKTFPKNIEAFMERHDVFPNEGVLCARCLECL